MLLRKSKTLKSENSARVLSDQKRHADIAHGFVSDSRSRHHVFLGSLYHKWVSFSNELGFFHGREKPTFSTALGDNRHSRQTASDNICRIRSRLQHASSATIRVGPVRCHNRRVCRRDRRVVCAFPASLHAVPVSWLPIWRAFPRALHRALLAS